MSTKIRNELTNEFSLGLEVVPVRSAPKIKKKLVRRAEPDHSQIFRRGFQFGFVLLNIYLGAQFYLWTRYYETGGQSLAVARPAGVEGWLPIAGLMNLRYWILTGRVPSIHPAAMFLLVAFLAIAFLLRKAFCSWLCPVGTISEYLWRFGRKFFGRNLRLPRWLDLPLRGLKYLLLGFFVWAVMGMSAEAIADFISSPYGVIADVKILNFFRYLSLTGLSVIALLVVASMLVQNFWCRYLCPYGALLGLAALASPLRIRRDPIACIDCAKCARACPSALAVDRLVTIRSAECTACMECVSVCPAEGALLMSLPVKKRRVPAWAIAAGVAALFLGIVGYARVERHWTTNLPTQLYLQLVPHAGEASHPMPGSE